ncbi:hypothetical protein EB796_017026 [Bugula neritina]|uniref:Carbohydrate sulfotransferase n=1 Tax=Bugula neritina TaxID=10212 RepID=A0A7J7JGA2_BUGNE|nr:hypothetical protein EB796_017026 [Bugula neritina]
MDTTYIGPVTDGHNIYFILYFDSNLLPVLIKLMEQRWTAYYSTASFNLPVESNMKGMIANTYNDSYRLYYLKHTMKLHLKYKCIIPSAIFLLLTYYIYSQYFAASFKHTSHQKSKKEPVAEAASYSKLSKINKSIGSQGSDLMSIKSENNANILKKISWYCESDAHLRELPIPTRMYNIPFHNLSLTLIAKVASTSWVAFLAQTSLSQCMVHLDKPSVGYASLHQCVKANLDTSSDNRRDNIRVVFVRDPWKRLVSVYKDKIVKQRFVQAASCYTRWNISRESNAESKNNPNLSFIQFLTCISEMGRNNPNWLDPHYRPQYLMHGPCSAGYTHIGEMNI